MVEKSICLGISNLAVFRAKLLRIEYCVIIVYRSNRCDVFFVGCGMV